MEKIDKAERGELTLKEMKELVQMLKPVSRSISSDWQSLMRSETMQVALGVVLRRQTRRSEIKNGWSPHQADAGVDRCIECSEADEEGSRGQGGLQ